MISSFRQLVAVLLWMALALGFSPSAFAQDAVLSGVAVRVNPGKLDEYLSRVKKLEAVMDRLGVEGSIEVWQATAAGPATGTTFVGIEYPSLVAYAEGDAKTQADAEFEKLIGGLGALRTIQSSSLYRQIAGPGRGDGVPAGSVLQSVVVRVKPGRLDDYLGKIEKLRKISERLGTTNSMRVWMATAAGENTGSVVVGVIYKDLASYAAESTKIQADPEWQKLVAGLSDMRTIVSTSLARNLGS